MGDGEHCTASKRILRQYLRDATKISFFSREFRLFSLQFGYCVDNKLLIVIRDLVNVDTKRSYLCLTQTFIVLWIAWSVSTSTDAVASSRRRILFLWVYCTYDLMLHFYVNGW